MTLSQFAGWLLKGSGQSQPPADNARLSESRQSHEQTSCPSFLSLLEPDDSRFPGCDGMVGNTFGESRGHSIASSWAKMRPLSDIRELTEPSLAETLARRPYHEHNQRSSSRTDVSRKISATSKRRPSADVRHAENKEPERKTSAGNNGLRSIHGRHTSRSSSPPSPLDNHSISSIYSIPPGTVPPRSSSRSRARDVSQSRKPSQMLPTQSIQPAAATASTHALPTIPLPPPKDDENTIPQRGHSQSPLRHVAARLDSVSHDTHRRVPSRTFVRKPLSKDLLEFPSHRHPRIELGLDLSASIFVGGGSIEGTAQIKIDDAERIRHRRTLDIARISIDLLGIEEMSGNRRSVFLNLASELIDEKNPPPQNMVDTQDPISSDDLFWHLMPSLTNLAFNLSLPLNVGPPPFYSKNARIRYVLCVSLLIRDQGKQYIVRTSEDVTVLSVYDPEKALVSLPSPLTASDEWVKPRDTTVEIVRVTAGLHRQVWVSGTSIYVDVHIANNSRKTIRKIELQMERNILCYKHVGH
ncbi:hypothetical protein NX059_002445 [Plenodomus lindquistii]|nr:hypothetical protein NX059_002445 [Plenodomus lindquistii]